MKKVLTVVFVLALVLGVSLFALPVAANTPASSTIYFESQPGFNLTDNGDGTYTGILPCKVNAGFDVFAKEGATAYMDDAPTLIGSDHDAWPTWTPDTPDWYQYSLRLWVEGGVQKWELRNHAGATNGTPWYTAPATYPARGVPMSGYIEWIGGTHSIGYAYETGTGAYLPTMGTAKYPGKAASHGGGAGYWDMDWSWGSEAVPLQYPGFVIRVSVGHSPDDAELDPGDPIGWETYPISKARVLLPWIALGVVIAAGTSLLALRRRRTAT